jgi:hypothetical protein
MPSSLLAPEPPKPLPHPYGHQSWHQRPPNHRTRQQVPHRHRRLSSSQSASRWSPRQAAAMAPCCSDFGPTARSSGDSSTPPPGSHIRTVGNRSSPLRDSAPAIQKHARPKVSLGARGIYLVSIKNTDASGLSPSQRPPSPSPSWRMQCACPQQCVAWTCVP